MNNHTRPGTIFVGAGPEVDKAFAALIRAIKSGVRKRIERSSRAMDEVLRSPAQRKLRAVNLKGDIT